MDFDNVIFTIVAVIFYTVGFLHGQENGYVKRMEHERRGR